MAAFTFTVTCVIPLSVQEICVDVWPHSITAEEVATNLRATYGDHPIGVLKWMQEWNMTDEITVEVNGVRVWGDA